MINSKDHPAAWAQLMSELEDAHEHLGSLISGMTRDGQIDIESYAIDVAHIYAHLNRAWNTRNVSGEITEEQWEEGRSYPTDLEPLA